MPRRYGGWPAYVPVARRRRNAAREVARLRKAGQAVAPVEIAGCAIATTVWGKAWCDNLEAYRDYESRLPRGRTYVRNGSVIDLQIAPREVQALVSGSEIYRVTVRIEAIGKHAWQSICTDCAGRIESLVELLQGRLSTGVMERLCRQDQGLFPKPSQIRFSCSCPDYASMCKHVAAVLYGVGARLDEQPDLLFRLRAVDAGHLIAQIGTALPTMRAPPPRGRVLENSDVAALFGLDMATSGSDDLTGSAIPPPVAAPKRPSPARASAAPERKPAVRKPAATAKAPGVGEGATTRMLKARAGQAATSRSATPPVTPAKAPGRTSKAAVAGVTSKHESRVSAGHAPRTPAGSRPAADKPVRWWLTSRSTRSKRPDPSAARKRR